MAKGNQRHERNKAKKLERRRHRENRAHKPTPLVQEPSAKLAEKINDAYNLIHEGAFARADELLEGLVERYRRCPAVYEAQLYLYQTVSDRSHCAAVAKRLMELVPRDPDARIMYAQESMVCGRLAIALVNYRLFLERWPNHDYAIKAKSALELLEPECLSKMQAMDLEEADEPLGLMLLHDEILESMECGKFKETVDRCLELLHLAPDFISARNNLALAYYQSGQVEKAAEAAEQTYRLTPENRFAEATLARLQFLNGRSDEANAIADRIVENPPTDVDPLAATIELLSFLGRDEDVVVLSQAANSETVDPQRLAVILHDLAVAQLRLGDASAARQTWKKCLRISPNFDLAQQNLSDLDASAGHAPWARPFTSWIPRALVDDKLKRAFSGGTSLALQESFPALAMLIPALLDRGDPIGREFALRAAKVDKSPAMLDALRQFASGMRGPDDMRYGALSFLCAQGFINSGPHRFYSRGQWTEVKVFTAKITCEQRGGSRWEELFEIGTAASNRGDYTLAEETFNKILEQDPSNHIAAYNLCSVWLNRDGDAGRQRAETKLNELRETVPDYLFVPIALAHLAAIDHDFVRAAELLRPIWDVKELHVSEAKAFFTTQVLMAVEQRRFEIAEMSLAALTQIVDQHDPLLTTLRNRIKRASKPSAASRIASLFKQSI